MAANVSMTQNGYTYHQPSGNRIVEGHGTFPDVEHMEFQLGSVPVWMVGVVQDDVARFVVVDAEGSATLLHSPDLALDLGSLPPGMPPIVHSSADGIALIQPPEDAAPLSHPILVEDGLLYIANNGDVVLLGDAGEHRFTFNAMLDSRMVVSSDGLVAFYSNPTTDRYVHGIIGDDVEAFSIRTLGLANGEFQRGGIITLQGTAVYEGLFPIWADVDGDGEDDLIATVSDNGRGAGIKVFDTNGRLLTVGPAIGQSNRWRHQIAWAALGENGESGLLEVLTPHIGGVVGFFTLSESGDKLERIASVEGYTSHVIGSRNLDMAVIGDFNGDSQMEAVLPTQDRTRIAGLQIQGDTFAEVWSLPLDGPLSTNLAAVTLPNGTLALGAGTEAGTVYLWLVP